MSEVKEETKTESHFWIHLKHQYTKDLQAKGGHRGVKVVSDKLNAEHDDVLKREFVTRKLCEKAFSKLPKEVQDITYIAEGFPLTELNKFFQ